MTLIFEQVEGNKCKLFTKMAGSGGGGNELEADGDYTLQRRTPVRSPLNFGKSSMIWGFGP